MKPMKKMTKLSALLAVAAAAPAVVAPTLVAPAQAQDRAEFQDVPREHWAYPALQKLAAAGVLEGYPPTGDFRGQRAMTRYEFAVAIARILERVTTVQLPPQQADLSGRVAALEARAVPDITRAQVNDLIAALRREFADELARLGGRVDVLETRVTTLENRVTPPPRLTITPSILHQTGAANYIDQNFGGRTFLNPTLGRINPYGVNEFLPGPGADIAAGALFPGSPFIPANSIPPLALTGALPGVPFQPAGNGINPSNRFEDKKFSYTDFEVRLTDRVSDRLSINAALRSLGSNQEDPWAGDSRGQFYLREAYASADLSNRNFFAFKNISTTLGRQRTKIGQGLLYDNDLSPTDQLRADANFGPLALTGFIGTTNNQTGLGIGADPYVTQGAVFNLNTFVGGNNTEVGFPGVGFGSDFGGNTLIADDNELLVRASANLFRLAGQPVSLGYSRLFDGFRGQSGDSVDLTLPLFNRTVGVELVRQANQTDGQDGAVGTPKAYNITVPVLRTSILDLNVAYGKAGNNFEYNVVSSANPYARSYGQAIFDRPIALGAPLIGSVGAGDGSATSAFLAAKQTFDVSGTLRLPLGFLRRVPLDFRYYTAESSGNVLAVGGGRGRVDLGKVYSVGTTFNVTPGLDLNVLGGVYDPDANVGKIRYVRVGASVGF